MKRIAVIALCLALLLAVCGCSEDRPYTPTGGGLTPEDGTSPTAPTVETQPDQELTLVYYPDRSLNPYTCTDYTNRTLFSLIYQGLFAVDREYTVQPLLCGRYAATNNNTVYTFYPAQATFSDGSALTAGDIAASLRAAMQKGSYYAGRFTHVTSIQESVDGGVIIRLDTPCENLPLLLDIPIVKQGQITEDRPLGTGPYTYASGWSGLSLRRVNGWWCSAQPPVTADTISLTAAESNAQIRDAFQFDDVGLVCADPCSDTYADYRSDYELWDCESGMFLYLGCNKSSQVFSDNSVRAALTYAVDREALASGIYRGFGSVASLPVSPSSPWYSQALASDYSYDPSRFTQALSAAGKSGSAVKLLVNQDDSLRLQAARAIGDTLSKCGLSVTISELSTADYKAAYEAGNYDLYLGQTRLSPNMDLSVFFSPIGALSYGGMDDGALYALCLQALENSGNYYDLCRAVMNDGRLCPVLFGNYAVYASRGLLSNLTPARDNVFCYDTGVPMEEVRDDTALDAPEAATEPPTEPSTQPEPTETEPSEP